MSINIQLKFLVLELPKGGDKIFFRVQTER